MTKNINQNTLIIPKGLANYSGVKKIFEYDKNSTILYKSLDYNLENVEFYTQTHCIVFNCNGIETITAYDFSSVEIGVNELLFLPKDMYLISDFIRNNKNLEAYLFFFDEEIIEKFLAIKSVNKKYKEKATSFYKMNINNSVLKFIESLNLVSKNQFNSKHFLELKLLELLHIVEFIDENILDSLYSINKNKNKRNIKSLMKKYFLSDFSMEDYAKLSGRSLSSFHRDFKKHNTITPKQYLLNLKLQYAKNELIKSHKNVSDIAMEIGYTNISHFIKAFKEKYNITPKQLSKSNF